MNNTIQTVSAVVIVWSIGTRPDRDATQNE